MTVFDPDTNTSNLHMKHILIVAVGLIGLAVFLNLDRIRNHLHPLRSQAAEAVPVSVPAVESGRTVVQPLQTNSAVAGMPTATTNAPATNGPATWQSTLAQDYAHLINDIRSARGN